MPEGHTILRAANRWSTLAGEPLALSSPQGRFSREATALDGRALRKAYAHGKHLFLEFSREETIHIHLGLYGRHRWHSDPSTPPKGAVRLRAEFSEGVVELIGPTRCELIGSEAVLRILARLGEDPLKREEPSEEFLQRMSKLSKPMAAVLMDQSLVAGVGNVYRAEVLFMEKINPMLPASELSRESWLKLWKLTRALMLHGVDHAGGIETIYEGSPAPLGMPQAISSRCASSTYVYGRTGEPCVACGEPILQEIFQGRKLYYCARDQS